MLSAYPRDWPGVAYSTLPSNPELRNIPNAQYAFFAPTTVLYKEIAFFLLL